MDLHFYCWVLWKERKELPFSGTGNTPNFGIDCWQELKCESRVRYTVGWGEFFWLSGNASIFKIFFFSEWKMNPCYCNSSKQNMYSKSESYPARSHYEQFGFYSLDQTWEFSFHGYRGSVWEDEKSSRDEGWWLLHSNMMN